MNNQNQSSKSENLDQPGSEEKRPLTLHLDCVNAQSRDSFDIELELEIELSIYSRMKSAAADGRVDDFSDAYREMMAKGSDSYETVLKASMRGAHDKAGWWDPQLHFIGIESTGFDFFPGDLEEDDANDLRQKTAIDLCAVTVVYPPSLEFQW